MSVATDLELEIIKPIPAWCLDGCRCRPASSQLSVATSAAAAEVNRTVALLASVAIRAEEKATLLLLPVQLILYIAQVIILSIFKIIILF